MSLQSEDSQPIEEAPIVSTGEDSRERKLSKKELAKLERQRKRREAAAASAAVNRPPAPAPEDAPEDKLAGNYGLMSLSEVQSKALSGKTWTLVKKVTKDLVGAAVLIRGHTHSIRSAGKNMVFVLVREQGSKIQCVLMVTEGIVSSQMVKFASNICRESFVEVEGLVCMPLAPIKGATQEVEIKVQKLYCISESIADLPLNVEEADHGVRGRVNLDTRLNNRVLDLRIPSNNAIFRLQSEVVNLFTQFLVSEDFMWTFTPKVLAGEAEGGTEVFKLEYFERSASLA